MAVTRHVLQLALLDATRRRSAVHTLHKLAAGNGESDSSQQLDIDREEPLHVTTSSTAKSAAVYCVWERSSARTPFFEAGTADAIRVWSIETSREHLDEVAVYVERAWDFGRLGDQLGSVASFPMGTTNELTNPARDGTRSTRTMRAI